MKTFALQNPDYKELFWSEDLGWASIEDADVFFSNELEEEHCLDLRRKGRWTEVKVTASIQ
jgi:hypothetical protein